MVLHRIHSRVGYPFRMAKHRRSRPAKDSYPPHRLKALREELGWSRLKLAQQADMSPGNITNLEDRRQGFSTKGLHKLAQALGCKPSDIIDPDLVPDEPGSRLREAWEAAEPDVKAAFLAEIALRGR